MKNENEIKRAFAMEVIEECRKVKKNYPEGSGAYSIVVKLQDFVQSLLPKEEEVDWYQKPFKELIGMRFRDVTYTDNIITIGHNYTIETDKDGDVYLSFGGDAVGWIKQHGVLAEIVEPDNKHGQCTCTNIGDAENCSKKCGRDLEETKTESNDFSKKLDALFEIKETESDEVKDEFEEKILKAQSYWKTLKEDQQQGIVYGLQLALEFYKSQPTLEQKARKKAEEMLNDPDSCNTVEQLTKALLIDPKTL